MEVQFRLLLVEGRLVCDMNETNQERHLPAASTFPVRMHSVRPSLMAIAVGSLLSHAVSVMIDEPIQT